MYNWIDDVDDRQPKTTNEAKMLSKSLRSRMSVCVSRLVSATSIITFHISFRQNIRSEQNKQRHASTTQAIAKYDGTNFVCWFLRTGRFFFRDCFFLPFLDFTWALGEHSEVLAAGNSLITISLDLLFSFLRSLLSVYRFAARRTLFVFKLKMIIENKVKWTATRLLL